MKNLVEYFKSAAPLEERKEKLFQHIATLDKESERTYSEIHDMGCASIYKFKTLSQKLEEMKTLYNQLVASYDYLYKIEMDSYWYAYARLCLRMGIATSVTAGLVVATSMISPMAVSIGSAVSATSYMVLLGLGSQMFLEEKERIDERVDEFSEETTMRHIKFTLENSDSLYCRKIDESNTSLEATPTSQLADVIVANHYINLYLSGELTAEQIKNIPPTIRMPIVKILKHDLREDSEELEYLFQKTKEQDAANKQYMKEIE